MKKLLIQLLKIIAIALVPLALLCGFTLNNMWLVLPEFYELDTIYNIPISIQVILIFLTFLLACAVYTNKAKKTSISLMITFTALSILSWYQIIFSQNTNDVNIQLLPFYNKSIDFSDIRKVKTKVHKIDFVLDNNIIPVYLGLYPIGLNYKSIETYLYRFDDCQLLKDNHCAEFGFNFP